MLTKKLFKTILFSFLIVLAFPALAQVKPNIVFILMDNLGYGEVGCYGGGIVRGAPTPRIDKLATEGTRLLKFNVEAQCTPSRSAILTGRFSIRSGTPLWEWLYQKTVQLTAWINLFFSWAKQNGRQEMAFPYLLPIV